MDGQWFDDIVRSVAGVASRRRVLRGLAAGAVAGLLVGVRGAQAQTAPSGPPPGLPLGSTCTAADQCRQYQGCLIPAAVACASNGIDADGALNCCLGEGGLCFESSECCGGLVCFGADGGDGCGAGQCFLPDSASGEPTFARTALIDANLRSGPSFDAAVLAVVPGGETVTIFPQQYENGFVLVEYAGQRGYVYAELLG